MLKKVIKWLGIAMLALLIIALLAGAFTLYRFNKQAKKRLATLGEEAAVLTEAGVNFRDLNKNGRLDVYENPSANVTERVDDLLGQMTLAEKAGTMFITISGVTPSGEPQDAPVLNGGVLGVIIPFMMGTNAEMVVDKKMNSFNIFGGIPAGSLAKHNNLLQKRAERTRLGIPVTIASDPRHAAEYNPGAAVYTPAFSQWPGPLGLAATRDTQLVQAFGNIARQEYLSTGIRLALHPMADLATEPRWGRANGTFGEDADLAAQMTKAYVLGFQGDSLTDSSVACMTKHFSGGGPQADGEDAHFPYGKEQVYPGDHFDYHVIPFRDGAFPAGTAQIMPYYGIPVGQTDEDVAFAFNKAIITRMLRDSMQFDGVICTDWNIISQNGPDGPRAWGVEGLSELERVKKVLDAGCDQFGGEARPDLLIELVNSGQVAESRLDVSVARILRDKFILGLFDDPYVDEAAAERICGNASFRSAGLEAQKKSVVLLKNEALLPLQQGQKVFVIGAQNPAAYAQFGEVVKDIDAADVVVYRLATPFDPRDDYFLESFFHQGRLHFSAAELAAILPILERKPTVVVANLERAAILTEVDAQAKSVLAEFGSSDEALAAIIFGEYEPQGKLPFELPRSAAAVDEQLEDVPYDSENPLYLFGHGLSY